MGPSMPPSTRVKAKASDSWVRVHPKVLSSATNHKPMAWNMGVVGYDHDGAGYDNQPPAVEDSFGI